MPSANVIVQSRNSQAKPIDLHRPHTEENKV